MYENLLKTAVAAALVCSLLFSSGCALLWLGAGGTGGYLIRKGEEGGGGSGDGKKTSSESSGKTSTY